MHSSNMSSQTVFSKSVIFTQFTLISDIFQMRAFYVNVQTTSIAASEITKVTFEGTTISMDTDLMGVELVFSGEYFWTSVTGKFVSLLMYLSVIWMML